MAPFAIVDGSGEAFLYGISEGWRSGGVLPKTVDPGDIDTVSYSGEPGSAGLNLAEG